MKPIDAEFVGSLEALPEAVGDYIAAARRAVSTRVMRNGKLDRGLADAEQRALHGLAWIGAQAEAVRQAVAWGCGLV